MKVVAWQRYGRGRHPAQLDFGDCLAYAAARVAGEPLLAKGSDFAQTDLPLVVPPANPFTHASSTLPV